MTLIESWEHWACTVMRAFVHHFIKEFEQIFQNSSAFVQNFFDKTARGQKILEAIYGVLNYPQKRTKNHYPQHLSFKKYSGQLFFVCFWGELRTP